VDEVNTLDPRAAPTRSTLSVAGKEVTVLRGGAGDPVLYLHGLCDMHANFDGTQWTTFLSRLCNRFAVVAPALPGYNGSTGALELDDVEDYVWHLVDVLDALELERVDVIAHSIGGWFGAELALRHPERLGKLVLLSPLGLYVPGLAIPPFFGAVAPRGVGGFGEARRLLFADPDGEAAIAALPDGMAEEQQLLWFAGLAGAARLGWKAPHFQSVKLAQRIGRIGVPALVVVGEQDLLVPQRAGEAWVAGMSSAQLSEVPDTGHCLALEWPQVADEVEGFLTEFEGM
jgi:pimeloyl-ACP methyl ester carboxylesterase